MKYYMNLDADGNVTGLFLREQRPDQKTLDEKDAKVVAYKAAKEARLTAAKELTDLYVGQIEALRTKT